MMITTLFPRDQETRVAITPHTANLYLQLGFEVAIEKNAGRASGFADSEYLLVGVQVMENKKNLLQQSDILLCVNEPHPQDLSGLKKGALIIGPLEKEPQSPLMQWSKQQGITLFSMDLIPRLSRAQNMDSLSSQASLAGYRAVLEAVFAFHRVLPMMMTAAGMIQPAKVLVLGAGVAGLQAIATAKRLGAIVYAFDVRSAAKEQVESLGAEFIEVAQDGDGETQGGYASESSEEYKKLQAQSIDKYAKLSDIVISTALIPQGKAPVLLYKNTVDQMKPGSVIVDLATARGGNCEVSVLDQCIQYRGITVIGYSNMAGRIPTTASSLYANNFFHLLQLLAPQPPALQFNPEDEIIQQALLCYEGLYLPFQSTKE